PERLVQGYVEGAMSQPEIREIAPRVLERMITNANTKEPRSITELTAETALSKQDIVACLVLLERKGLVRRFGDLWEISHDFVARQFALLLGRLRPNPWPRAAMVAASVSFIFFLFGVAIGVSVLGQEQAFATLRSLRISVAEGPNHEIVAKIPAS